MQRRIIAGLGLLALTTAAQAADYNIDDLQNASQTNFRLLSEDLGAALSYKPVAPAEPLGLSGFDLGIEVSSTKVQHPEAWQDALGSSAPSSIVVPKLHLHKGLPLDFDIGAFYATVPSSNIDLVGAELKYALVKGGTATPAVAARATYTKLSGVEQLAFDTTGVELAISKGFAMFTPYAGIGRVKVNSEPQGDAAGPGRLSKESFSQSKSYVGVNINLGLNIALEADKTGDASSYSVKFGIRF